MNKTKTIRGFALIKFKDTYQQLCSLQKSSVADYDAIWLGISNTGPNFGNEFVRMRMHLSKKEVRKLIPHLQKFLKTGEI